MDAVTPALGSSPLRRIGDREFDFSRRVAVMAVVNRTRDSFYDKGATFDLPLAVAAVERAVAAGADWLDIGGVPFSATAEPVDAEEELRRVLPLVREARRQTDAVVSVDTYRPQVAEAALAAGATAINDTSGLRDPDMASVAAATGAALVVTHSAAAPREVMRRPTYDDVVAEVRDVLVERVDVARARGVADEQLIVDPGHDLNKNTLHSLELTRELHQFAGLGFPLLVAVSNKHFIGEVLDLPKDRRTIGTAAVLVMCVLQGARIVRVHDTAAAVSAVRMTEGVLGWREPAVLRHNIE